LAEQSKSDESDTGTAHTYTPENLAPDDKFDGGNEEEFGGEGASGTIDVSDHTPDEPVQSDDRSDTADDSSNDDSSGGSDDSSDSGSDTSSD
jgi:hypothetical protein